MGNTAQHCRSGLFQESETQGNTNSVVHSSRETGARPKITPKPKQTTTKHVDLSDMDQVLVNAHSSQGESRLYIFKDNEAVIKMVIKGTSPTMTHVSRTRRVALDWLFDRIKVRSQDSNQIC